LRGRRSRSVSNFKSSGVVLYICTSASIWYTGSMEPVFQIQQKSTF
jgi:hypothetical protein